MCDFCENIPKTDEEFTKARRKGTEDIIFYDIDFGFSIFGYTGDSGCPYCLNNIKFCPLCGRKLSVETEKPNIDEIFAKLKKNMTEDDYEKLNDSIKSFSDGINGLWEVMKKGIENGYSNKR